MRWINLFKSFPSCDTDKLRAGVQEAYSAASRNPSVKHPFPVGRNLAESIGYPPGLLDSIPPVAWDAFAGVSNVSIFADLPQGATVLDIGCGSGLDTVIAAQRVGPSGKVIGVDFSEDMLNRARQAIEEVNVSSTVEFHRAAAEELPLKDKSIDVILINGIFNLNPNRGKIFRELFRVLREERKVFAAELVFTGPVKTKKVRKMDDWFSWIAGTKESGAFLEEFKTAGFFSARILRTSRNARTNHPKAVVADVVAVKEL